MTGSGAAAQAPGNDSRGGAGAQSSPSNPATAHPSTGSNTASTNKAPAKPHTGGTSLQATSEVEPAGPSPLIGWGIALVALSLAAGIAVVRMRRV